MVHTLERIKIGRGFKLTMDREIKLHLGRGKRYIPGFVHIDLDDYPHIDYRSEISDLSMFEDNSKVLEVKKGPYVGADMDRKRI